MQGEDRVKTYAKFRETPLRGIQPEGWLRVYLETQRNGLTGHLEVGQWPFDTDGWAGPGPIEVTKYGGQSWIPYESTAYITDAMVRCGHLLNDSFLVQKAMNQIDYVLEHPDSDGYLGPQVLKENRWWYRWPHAVFFRAMAAHHSATGDPRVLPALTKHYLAETSPHTGRRDMCNIEAMLWTYARTGDRRLLELAVKAFENYDPIFHSNSTTLEGMLSDDRIDEHGVTINEICKLSAILYSYTGEKKLLDAPVNAYRKLARDQVLIDGVCSGCESLQGNDPLDSHETCDAPDYTWALGYLLMASGEAEYADKIERACFNGGPGGVKSDFKSFQYNSCPNQVILDRTSNHNPFMRGNDTMRYGPNPSTECCTGNVNRLMPNYATRMWMEDGRGGLVAALYGPSRITARVGPAKQEVTVVEETGYPFAETIEFQVRTAQPVRFPLSLRIPGWCREATIKLNGQRLRRDLKAGTFVKLDRVFHPNDRVTLELPMELKLSRWAHGGIGVERGPLVYSLRIEEDWRLDPLDERTTKDFPAWVVYAASAWNYALAVDEENLAQVTEIVHRPLKSNPWSAETAPIELRLPARRVRGWKIEKHKVIDGEWVNEEVLALSQRMTGDGRLRGDFAFTPQLPDTETLGGRLGKRLETVTLIPYGCTTLRISIFPQAL